MQWIDLGPRSNTRLSPQTSTWQHLCKQAGAEMSIRVRHASENANTNKKTAHGQPMQSKHATSTTPTGRTPDEKPCNNNLHTFTDHCHPRCVAHNVPTKYALLSNKHATSMSNTSSSTKQDTAIAPIRTKTHNKHKH